MLKNRQEPVSEYVQTKRVFLNDQEASVINLY